MSEAPKRIWAGNWLADVGETSIWDMGEWRDVPWPTVDVVEYIRADLVEAAIKRALEGASRYHGRFLMVKTSVDVEAVVASEEAIRALDPAQFIEEPKG